MVDVAAPALTVSSGTVIVDVAAPDPTDTSGTSDTGDSDTGTDTGANTGTSNPGGLTTGSTPSQTNTQTSFAIRYPANAVKGRGAANAGFFGCTSYNAGRASAANLIGKIPGLGSGVGGFIVNAIAGNVFSGITDIVMSIGNGQAGGNNVFYNIGQGIAAGPTLGLGALLPNAVQEIPGVTGPIDSILGTAVGAGTWATIGVYKLIYDGVTFAGAGVGCGMGWLPGPSAGD